MKKQKLYEADDKMISLIRDNYSVLQSLGSFGISLGFGDKTVSEVCESEGVDTRTFLAVVNFSVNNFLSPDDAGQLSVATLLKYLKASHQYYLGFELPAIKRELQGALDSDDSVTRFIMKLYNEFAQSIHRHMLYEERTVFPYVQSLLDGVADMSYDVDTFSKHHGQTTQKLQELKSVIIRYLPSDKLHNNQLMATLFDIYKCEAYLSQHAEVEDNIFVPAIRLLERKMKQSDVSMKISHMINKRPNADEDLSEREKEVIVSVVQGMTNKEIADHLCIATSTVITHRRNIARKLQIHSSAGLTIYAIVNNLVDISNVKL